MATQEQLNREAAALRRRKAELDRAAAQRRNGCRQIDRREFERLLAAGKLDRRNLDKPNTVENMLARSFEMTGGSGKREAAVMK